MKESNSGNADLYRFDGRNFEINEENGVLTFQLRRSVRVERTIIAILIAVLNFMVVLMCEWFFHIELHAAATKYGISILLYSPGAMAFSEVWLMKRGEIWKFDKSSSKVQLNQLHIANFPQIRGVRAWRRGRRFYIALQLRYGQTIKLARLAGFGRSEHSWGQDAAQIAQFLEVPLEIPPVIPA